MQSIGIERIAAGTRFRPAFVALTERMRAARLDPGRATFLLGWTRRESADMSRDVRDAELAYTARRVAGLFDAVIVDPVPMEAEPESLDPIWVRAWMAPRFRWGLGAEVDGKRTWEMTGGPPRGAAIPDEIVAEVAAGLRRDREERARVAALPEEERVRECMLILDRLGEPLVVTFHRAGSKVEALRARLAAEAAGGKPGPT